MCWVLLHKYQINPSLGDSVSTWNSHFIFRLVLFFRLSQDSCASKLHNPMLHKYPFLSEDCLGPVQTVKGPVHFTLQRFQRTNCENRASPRGQKPPDEVDKDFCRKLCGVQQRILLHFSYYNTVQKWSPCCDRSPEMSKEVCIKMEGQKSKVVSGLSASSKAEESQGALVVWSSRTGKYPENGERGRQHIENRVRHQRGVPPTPT